MSIEHLKKQAKNLHRLLPEFLAKNPQPFSLSSCQELAARASGYPSWHAASTASKNARKADSIAPARKPTFFPVDVSALRPEEDMTALFRRIRHIDPDTVIFVNGSLPLLSQKLVRVGCLVEELSIEGLRARLEKCDYDCGYAVFLDGDRVIATGQLSESARGSRVISMEFDDFEIQTCTN